MVARKSTAWRCYWPSPPPLWEVLDGGAAGSSVLPLMGSAGLSEGFFLFLVTINRSEHWHPLR